MKESSNRESSGADQCGTPISYESLEERMLLSGPTFATALADAYWVPSNGGGRTIAIDGSASGTTPLTITAVSDNPGLTVTVAPNTDHFALLHFVQPASTAAGAATTPIGDILVQIFDSSVPEAAQRFLTLATDHVNADKSLDPTGTPYYTNVLVHRVIPGFMIQTGDAQYGTGSGGSPLGSFPDAFPSDLSYAGPGVLAYANSGPDTSDSQFFITAAPYLKQDGTYFGTYVIFGQVISGMDVLNKIINVSRDTSNNDRPYNPPVLTSVQIVTSPQDGTINLMPQAGFSGVAHVTVTLDDGHGHKVQKVISVRSMSEIGSASPVIAPQPEIRVAPGGTATFTASATDDGTLPVNFTVRTDVLKGTVSVDNTTKLVTITAPTNFTGMMKVQSAATEGGGGSLNPLSPGWSDHSPTYQMVYVMVTGPADMPYLNRVIPASGNASEGTFQFKNANGNWLVSADGTAGLTVYNVNDPANPQLAGTQPISGYAQVVKVVHIGNQDVAIVADFDGGLVSVDVTDPYNMQQLGSFELPWDHSHDATGDPQKQTYYSLAQDVVIAPHGAQTIAWVAGLWGGAFGIDISDPTNLQLATTVRAPNTNVTIAIAVSVAVKDNYLFISDPDGAIIVADVSNLASPTVTTVFAQGQKYVPWGLSLSGNTLFMADNKYLVSWDVTNPAAPKKLGQLSMPGSWIVQAQGSLAIVARNGGYAFVNVSNPRKMVQTNFYAAAESVGFNPGDYSTWSGMPSLNDNVVSLPIWANGTVLLRGAVVVSNGSKSFVDANGVTVTVKVSKGSAVLTTTGVLAGHVDEMSIIGTSATTVSITTSGGVTSIDSVVVTNGSLKSFSAPTTDLAGDFTVDGSVGSLSLHDVGDGIILINGTAPGAVATATPTMSFDQLSGTTIESPYFVKSISAVRWIGGTVEAPSIGSISVTGSKTVVGDLTVAIDTALIKSISVKHDLLQSILTLTQAYDPANAKLTALGSLSVGGLVDNTQIRSRGNIGSITAGAFSNSLIYAGVNDDVISLPTMAANFINADTTLLPTIASLTVKGIVGQTIAFTNTKVAAWTINKVSIKPTQIQTGNGGQKFGFTGHIVKPYVAPVAPQGDFEVRLI